MNYNQGIFGREKIRQPNFYGKAIVASNIYHFIFIRDLTTTI